MFGLCAPRAFSERFVIRPILVTTLFALALAGCSKSGGPSTSSAPYAGLDTEFVSWRAEIEATHPVCKFKVDKKGCEAFQVTCKAQQEITASEAASGITAQIVAAMTFMGRGADGSSDNPGSAFAVFSKARGAWTRVETSPVNLSSCAPA
jgi:hypothetical protein